MKLSKITKKQREILILLYRYRYLNREQIQAFLRHKDRKTINLWLRDLREKEYVGWIYSDHFAEKTKPAIYYLGINGIRWLKTIMTDDDTEPYYPVEEVRKRYRDRNRSEDFVTQCTMTAQCAIDFITLSDENVRFRCFTQADYLDPDHVLHFLTKGDLESQLGPQLFIAKRGSAKVNYLLEFFDSGLPRYRMNKRLKQYIAFLTEGDWGDWRECGPFPNVFLVCPRTSDLIYAKRRTRGLLGGIWSDDKQKRVKMHFTTLQRLKAEGATGAIWEKA